MAEESSMKVIARIKNDFPTKLGIPRQSGLVRQLRSTVVFDPECQVPLPFASLLHVELQ